jgi:hypothetical protein
MSKSRYSKNKSDGLMCGITRYKDMPFKSGNAPANVENRAVRRMRRKVK